jgi:hypothetical protein
MALPLIKLPTFLLNLISTGKTHKYHPYTAKDQEILLIALEGGNKLEIVNACEELLNNCVEGIDVKSLPIFDFEFLFLKLRVVSSGEIIKLSVPHLNEENLAACDHREEVELNLNDVKVRQFPDHKKTIGLTDDVGVIMRYPTISNAADSTPKDLLIACIESIYDKEIVYPTKDSTKAELEEWAGTLENKHILKIKQFFDTMPQVYLEVTYTCSKCGKTETRIVEGFDNFFTTP